MSPVYRTLDAFYAAVEAAARLESPEIDYGCWWRASSAPTPCYRVAWIQHTGEVIAVRASIGMPTEVLGVISAAEYGDRPELTVDVVLAGWQIVCGLGESLEWVRVRLHQYRALGAQLFGGHDGEAPGLATAAAYERIERALADRRSAIPHDAPLASIRPIATRRPT